MTLDFTNPEKLPVLGGEVEMFDFAPPRLTSETPVLYMQGFGQTPQGGAGIIETLRSAGRRVIALSYSPTINVTRELGAPSILATEAGIVLVVLHHKALGPVDVVAHSQGATTAILAATKEPEHFRHFVLFSPQGFSGALSYFEILYRMQRYYRARRNIRAALATEQQRAHFDESIRSVAAWLKRRGRVRGLYESLQASRLDISERVRTLRKAGHGVALFIASHDLMIPIERLQYKDRKHTMPRTPEDLGVDSVHNTPGGGEIFLTDQEPYATEAIAELDALAKRYTAI